MHFSPTHYSVGLVGIVLLACGLFLYTAHVERKHVARLDSYTFSTTELWDPLVYRQKVSDSVVVGRDAFSIDIPPPPGNSSDDTKAELRTLHQLEEARTQTHIAQIKDEISIGDTQWAGTSYTNLLNARPHTRILFERVLSEFNAVVVTQKEHFDRVRPSKLDTTLTPAISLPGHPSYPSGHASQSMLIALILSSLNPLYADRYYESAREIAHNREIAGVHYPSDSEAGQLLAEEYFLLLRKSDVYAALFAAAKVEW